MFQSVESSEKIFIWKNLNYSLSRTLDFNHLTVLPHGDRSMGNVVNADGQREAASIVQTLEVAVKVLMRSDHQQLDSLWVQNAVGEQARLVDHLELVYLHTGQIADLGFANFRGSGDCAHRLIKFRLLLAVQLFDDTLESRGDE